MKRTNSLIRFAIEHRCLLMLTVLLFVGIGGGIAVYASFSGEFPEQVQSLLSLRPAADSLHSAFSQLLLSCFQMLVLLTVLFVTGMSACGAPVAVLMPLFWGVGLGLSLAYYYSYGVQGILLCASLLLPPLLPKVAVLLVACTRSLHMSTRLFSQLLPHGARCGGLWQAFRTYCVRFLLLLPPLLLGGMLDVGLRALLLRFFTAFTG